MSILDYRSWGYSLKTLHERADVIPLLAEVFRELGYEGATLSRIRERTGLGKGSLYHFFPGGKEDMAQAVLSHISQWFEESVFLPLQTEESQQALMKMFQAVDEYFQSGKRICLIGAFAMEETRDRFSLLIRQYFQDWHQALQNCLIRNGHQIDSAYIKAEEVLLGIQGALVLARAKHDPTVFIRTLNRLKQSVFSTDPM